MKLLNIGCGSVRPGEPWTNLDDLHSQLKPGTQERINLDKEHNYINHKLPGSMPFSSAKFDGILCSHVLEHFDCHGAANIVADCWRVLKPDGIFVVSVPNTKYFMYVLDRDTRESSEELFGEPICPAEPLHKSFFDYALWYNQHKQLYSRQTLIATLVRGGFDRTLFSPRRGTDPKYREIEKIMNRRKFSLEICAVK